MLTLATCALAFSPRGGLPRAIQALFQSSEVGVWYDPADLSTLYQDNAGTTPVTAVGQVVGLMLDKSQGGSGAAMYRGLDGVFDYYLDAVGGSDANDGTSPAAAWKTFSKITGTLLSAGVTTRVYVKAGTYADALDSLVVNNGPLGCVLEVSCEPGVIMDGTAGSAIQNTLPVYIGDNGYCTFNLYGNGLIIRDYNYTTGGASPNGIGYGGAGITVNIYDTTIDGCVDGISGHTTGHGNFYDCIVKNSIKWVIANVSGATMDAYRCNFQSTGTETSGFATLNAGGGLQRFYDSKMTCAVNPSLNWEIENAEYYRCQFGTVINSISVVVTNVSQLFEDCFVNARVQAWPGVTYRRCYGYLSARVRNGVGSFTVENCILAGPATGLTNILYSNFDDGGSAQWVVRNNIFETATAAAFMSVDAINAGYLVAKSSEFFNNILSGSAAFDADFIAADAGGTVIVGNVTADALIGAANTLDPDDYGYASGSPAIGAATDGGNSGFAIGDVSLPTEQQVRGPDGVPGIHATTTGSPISQATYTSLDRLDDYLTAATGGAGTTGFLAVCGIRASGTGTARTIWSDAGTNTGYKLTLNTSNQVVLSAGNGTAYTSATTTDTVTDGTDYVITAWHDGTNLNVQVNNGTVATAAFVTATAGTAGFTIGRDNGAATGYFGERIHGVVYRQNDASTASERASVKAYMASKAGVTL